jgi:hypothetical protein
MKPPAPIRTELITNSRNTHMRAFEEVRVPSCLVSRLASRRSICSIPGAAALLFLALLTMFLIPSQARANPAFARKYGMPCSGCHVAWPLLNNFGQVFKDNGYQMMNDRDAPIWRDQSYWPIAMYGIPEWHRESSSNQIVDTTAGNPSAQSAKRVSSTGFDFSGIAWWMSGTLNKNISFLLLPTFFTNTPASAGGTGNAWVLTFESAWARFDNLFGSSWLNLKMGKYELDLPVSEKRSLNFSNYGGLYYVYHFFTPGTNPLMIADLQGLNSNQVGIELMGHNSNSYTRYAFSVMSSTAGNFGQLYGNGVDFYGHFQKAWNMPHDLGYMKASAFAYFGWWPTYWQTSFGAPTLPGTTVPTPIPGIPGSGAGDKPWTASGASLLWFTPKWVWSNVFVHGTEDPYLATNTAYNTPTLLPTGAKTAIWNGGFSEADYLYTPQLAFIGRYEIVRVQQQAVPNGTTLNDGITVFNNSGNLDALTFGVRWYPFMTTRVGFAVNPEYSVVRSRAITNNLFAGSWTPTFGNRDATSSSIFLGLNMEY